MFEVLISIHSSLVLALTIITRGWLLLMGHSTVLSLLDPRLELTLSSYLGLELPLPVLKLLPTHLLWDAELLRLFVFLFCSPCSLLFHLLLATCCVTVLITHAIFILIRIAAFIVLQRHQRHGITLSIFSGSLLLIGEHSHALSLLLTLVLVLHKAVEFLLVVVLNTFHALRRSTVLNTLLLLSMIMLDRAVTCWMGLTVAEVAKHGSTVNEELLRAVLELVALLAT